MKRSQLKNSFLLLLTAAIWGSAFVAQSVGMDYVKPFTFNGVRSAIGALFLIPCIFFFQNRTNSSEVSPADQIESISQNSRIITNCSKNIILRRAMLWYCAGGRFFPSADWNFLHKCWKGWLSDCHLYCSCADS